MSESALLLTDLPAEMKEKIANELDYKSKMSLRQVSKDFKKAVDNSEFFYTSLSLNWDYNQKRISISLQTDNASIPNLVEELKFQAFANGFTVTNKYKNWEKSVKRSDYNYIDGAMERFWKILKHRNRAKIHIKYLGVTLQDEYILDEDFPGQLSQIKEKLKMDPTVKDSQKLSVRYVLCQLDNEPNTYLNLLLCLKPGTIDDFSMFPSTHFQSGPRAFPVIDMTEIVRTEQWKQANTFQADNCHLEPKCLGSCHHKEMEYSVRRVELNDIMQIIENFFSNFKLNKIIIGCKNIEFEAIATHFSQFNPHVIRHNRGLTMTATIRRGRDACEIKIYSDGIFVTRV